MTKYRYSINFSKDNELCFINIIIIYLLLNVLIFDYKYITNFWLL